MFSNALKQIKPAIMLFTIFTILTGIIYPIAVTVIAQLFFNWEANGSLIKRDEVAIGSALIGQSFTGPAYFWGRPSATTPFPYNAANSKGSNLAPSNPLLLQTVNDRVKAFHLADPDHPEQIPVDLVTTSASGLDPDISPLAAFYQVRRIAKARHLQEKDIQMLIQKYIKYRFLNILGEPRVNVLELNIGLNELKKG